MLLYYCCPLHSLKAQYIDPAHLICVTPCLHHGITAHETVCQRVEEGCQDAAFPCHTPILQPKHNLWDHIWDETNRLVIILSFCFFHRKVFIPCFIYHRLKLLNSNSLNPSISFQCFHAYLYHWSQFSLDLCYWREASVSYFSYIPWETQMEC